MVRWLLYLLLSKASGDPGDRPGAQAHPPVRGPPLSCEATLTRSQVKDMATYIIMSDILSICLFDMILIESITFVGGFP